MTTGAQRLGPTGLVIAALVGLAISIYHYVTPMTGVTGTAGALLVVVSSLLLSVAGIVLFLLHHGWVAALVRVLAVLGSVGTLLAAYFLHEFWLMAAMVVALLAIFFDLASKRGAR